ncbi:MAG: bifunctional 4-hydroxy-2-oxoglutarate aldolase/2-dehydro-3-deoxy-phosphogluconate aldolase [Cyanobacteria bacterium KgW148]|nr:bifunctional 4-hydroxy-2-oxoglutarate aldolase/2-dehydro-3-deoxy-phosphogluconate aldolase [Cyanobacteria bacterium KgW148]
MPDFLTRLKRSLVVAVIRADEPGIAGQLTECVASAGIELIEISYHTPQLDLIFPVLRSRLGHCLLGVGTITDKQSAQIALDLGSQFLFSPIYCPEVVNLARDRGIPIVSGASTPTEIFRAWQGGADAIKVFPIANLGGASYIKAIRAVFPTIPLIPTGGVTIANASPLLAAGAIGLGISGYFLPESLVQNQDWQGITDRVRQLLTSIGL